MVARVASLTPAQRARMAGHAARWIEASFATGPADRRRFEEAARRCYVYAGIPWHGTVVWMSSPLTLTLAVLLIQSRQRGAYADFRKLLQCNVRHSLGEAAWDEIERAIEQARNGWVNEDRLPDGLTAWAAGSEVPRAIVCTVRDAPGHELARSCGVWGTVHPKVQRAIVDGVQSVVQLAQRRIAQAIDTAVDNAVRDLCEHADWEILHGLMADTLNRAHCILRGPLDPFSPDLRRQRPPFVPHPSYSSFLREVCGLELPDGLWDKAQAYEQTMRAGWWYPHRHFLLVCERPQGLHREPGRQWPGAQQLHHADGPAISWPGGWSIHAFHGYQVPGWILEHPDAITLTHIERAANTEVRRLMIQRYGWERYIRDCGAIVVDTVPMDHPIRGLRGARLLRKDVPGQEPVIYLDMINSTPEPDGSYKHYFERINPHAYGGDAARSCHAAMASRWFYRNAQGQLQPSFERWQDYLPDAES